MRKLIMIGYIRFISIIIYGGIGEIKNEIIFSIDINCSYWLFFLLYVLKDYGLNYNYYFYYKLVIFIL